MPLFRNPKKKATPKRPLASAPEPEGTWEPASVFFAQPPPGVVHLVVRPAATDGVLELQAATELVPAELRAPNSRVEVLLHRGQILGVRPAGPGAASWFAQSSALQS